MKAQLIAMMTYNDRTVENSLELFESSKDLPVNNWGFKDKGIPRDKMYELIGAMKRAGKTTFMEVVSRTEEECMEQAKLAVDMGFDYITGTLFFPPVWEYLKKQDIKYFPFVGKHVGTPGVLDGTLEEMLAEAEHFAELGIAGVDLSAFRYTGDPYKLARDFTAACPLPVCIAGSIADRERIKFVDDIGVWSFTIGSALFNGTFCKNGSFRENLEALLRLMEEINP